MKEIIYTYPGMASCHFYPLNDNDGTSINESSLDKDLAKMLPNMESGTAQLESQLQSKPQSLNTSSPPAVRYTPYFSSMSKNPWGKIIILNLQNPTHPKLTDYRNLTLDSYRNIMQKARPGGTSRGLYLDAKKDKIPVQIVDLSKKYQWFNTCLQSDLPQVSDTSLPTKIYLVGHCRAGSDTITGRDLTRRTQSFTYTEIANLIQEYRDKGHINRALPLRISIIACEAAQKAGTKKSFAEKLSEAICRNSSEGEAVEVLARTQNVSRRTRRHSHRDHDHQTIGFVNAFGHDTISEVGVDFTGSKPPYLYRL